jgi:FkbM family methyltransferase
VLAGHIRAYRQLLAFRKELHNWREVRRATREGIRGVTLELRNGMTIRSGSRDDVVAIFNEIFVERCYCPVWFYRAEPDHRVLDVGANVGLFSLFLSSVAPGIRVFAFEPQPETFERLTRNLAENGLEGSITARRLAVGRGRGKVRFSGVGGLASGHEAATSEGLGESVECISLAEALELAGGGPIHLLKVDTEGAEAEIVGFAPLAVWSAIARVVVEYHDLSKRDQVLVSLQSCGYRCRVNRRRGSSTTWA